jgi:serine/threonine-protein kinase
MCEGLAEAHGKGVVHRDIKPSNLFVVTRPDGTPLVKLIDFGIAKAGILDANAELTRTDSLLGSPSYASPEQLTAPRSVDARSDVWACGVTLFRMVTGQLPFEGETLAHVCMNVVGDPAPPVRSLNGDISAALEAAIARCLEKEASRRFPTVAALAHALEPCSSAPARGTARRVDDILLRAAASEEAGEAGEASGPRLMRTPPPLDGSGATTSLTSDTTSTTDAERTRTGTSSAAKDVHRLRWVAPLVALAAASGVVVFASHREAPAAVATPGAVSSDPSASALASSASSAADPGPPTPPATEPPTPSSTAASLAAITAAPSAPPSTPRKHAGSPRVRAHSAPQSSGTGATLVCPGDPRCTR